MEIILLLVAVVVAFAGGLWIARRFTGPRAETRNGRLAGRVVDLLFGAAAGALAAHIWIAVDSLREEEGAFLSVPQQAQTIAYQLASAFWVVGALVGLATILHLIVNRGDRAV